jgi:hypothetical protein
VGPAAAAIGEEKDSKGRPTAGSVHRQVNSRQMGLACGRERILRGTMSLDRNLQSCFVDPQF